MCAIPNFPLPYPDELLYSVMARYHFWRRNLYYADTIVELLGKKSLTISSVLPNRLEMICEKLFDGLELTADTIKDRHTMLPLYRPFLSEAQNQRIEDGMRDSHDKSLLSHAGLLQSRIPFPKSLRFCNECYKEDKTNFGEAYWHRSHQVFGVDICPTHQTVLMETNIPFTMKRNRQALYRLSSDLLVGCIPTVQVDKLTINDLYISQYISELLSNSFPILGTEKIGDNYRALLIEKGYANINFTMRKTELMNAFHSFYNNEFLKRMESNIESYKSLNWIDKLVRPKGNSHPLHHLLFMHFLGVTPKDFLNELIYFTANPFGSGPWKCFNGASEHFNQKVITKCTLKWGSQGKVVGTFTCSCGFIYARALSAEENDDYSFGRVIKFGADWERELIKLRRKENKTIKEVASSLKVTPLTVIRNLRKLESSEEEVEEKSESNLEQTYKEKWLKIISENPNAMRTELRQIAKKEYIWLYRHEKDWLLKHSPAPKKKKKVNQVNWKKRDEEISFLLEIAIQKLKEINVKKRPIRISVAAASKEIGNYSLIVYGLEKMPKSKSLLDNAVETTEQFQIRRIKWAVEYLKNIGESVTYNKVRKAASLTSSNLTDVIKNTIAKEVGVGIKI